MDLTPSRKFHEIVCDRLVVGKVPEALSVALVTTRYQDEVRGMSVAPRCAARRQILL